MASLPKAVAVVSSAAAGPMLRAEVDGVLDLRPFSKIGLARAELDTTDAALIVVGPTDARDTPTFPLLNEIAVRAPKMFGLAHGAGEALSFVFRSAHAVLHRLRIVEVKDLPEELRRVAGLTSVRTRRAMIASELAEHLDPVLHELISFRIMNAHIPYSVPEFAREVRWSPKSLNDCFRLHFGFTAEPVLTLLRCIGLALELVT